MPFPCDDHDSRNIKQQYRTGYRPVTAAEQIYYIIKWAAGQTTRKITRLWRK